MRGGSLSTAEAVELLRAGYQPINAVIHVGRWTLDTEISTKRGKVYVNEPTKKVYVVYAGTDSTTDTLNNAFVLFKSYTFLQRYKDAYRVQRDAIIKYGPDGTKFHGKVNTLSHSQGSGIVQNLIKAGLAPFNNIAVNPAAYGSHEKLRVIRSRNDVISVLSNPEIVIAPLSRNPVREHDFRILNRIQKNLSESNGGMRTRKLVRTRKNIP